GSYLAQYDAEVAGILATGTRPTAPILAVLGDDRVPAPLRTAFAALFPAGADRFLSGYFRVDPTVLLRQYRRPVLVLQGTADTNVFAAEDTPLVDRALSARPHDRHLTVLVDGASHFLKLIDPARPASALDGPVAPRVL